MDNNDNIEDFFKNQLNRFDEPMEDWEKPDVGDWENISSKVSLFNKTAFWTVSNIGLASLGTVLVCSLLYISQLNKQVNTLEQQLQVQNETIREVNKTIEIINKKQINKNITIEKENEVLKQQNKVIQTQNQLLKSITTQQQKMISNIQKNNTPSSQQSILNQEREQNTFKPTFKKSGNGGSNKTPSNAIEKVEPITVPIAENRTEENNKTNPSTKPKGNLKQTTIENENTQALVYLASTQTEAVIDKQKHQIAELAVSFDTTNTEKYRTKRPGMILPEISLSGLQIGYELRAQGMGLNSKTEVSGLNIGNERKSNYQVIPLHGLTLDIPVTKKWSVQTGVRYSSTIVDTETYGTGFYSTENEYTLPSGTIAKDLSVTQSTPFSSTTSEVQVIMEQNEKFEDGDVFTLYNRWSQDQQMLQIPLGLSHQVHIKKWTLSASMGAQWNQIWYGRYWNDFKLYKDESDQFFRANIISTDLISDKEMLSYWSGYLAVGFQYQIFDHWSVNLSSTSNYNFLEKPVDNELALENRDAALSIGVKYHF